MTDLYGEPLKILDSFSRTWQQRGQAGVQSNPEGHIAAMLRDARHLGVLREVDETVSDGYHTFGELYRHRMLLNAALFNTWHKHLPMLGVHKSKLHSDGEKPFDGGWFIVVAQLPTGQISYHYELQHWDLFDITEEPHAAEWDGHTSAEAALRLHEWVTR